MVFGAWHVADGISNASIIPGSCSNDGAKKCKCIMIVTKDLVYRALKEAAMYSPPASLKCRQLQAFRVLERGGLISTENLGATICDKDRNWFWSRVWSASKTKAVITWEFPILLVIERGFTLAEPLKGKGKQCVTYNVTVLDKYTEGCEKGKCDGCEGRTVNDIYQDTEYLLFQALAYLYGMRFITIGADTYSMHQKELEKHLSDGNITTYTEGKKWGEIMESKATQADGYRTSIEAEKLYGTSVNLTLCNDVCYVDGWDFSKAVFEP